MDGERNKPGVMHKRDFSNVTILKQRVRQGQSYPLKKVKYLFTILMLCALAGCAAPKTQVVYKDKPQTVVIDSGPFNATDYEKAVIDFRNEGQFELAGAAAERARNLRRAGDTSTKLTPFRITVKDLEDAAVEFDAQGKHALADEAREAARRLQNKQGKQPQQPPIQRSNALKL